MTAARRPAGAVIGRGTTGAPARASRLQAVVGLALGVFQIVGAVTSVALYAARGADGLTTTALTVTTAALLVSLLAFRRRELHAPDDPPRP